MSQLWLNAGLSTVGYRVSKGDSRSTPYAWNSMLCKWFRDEDHSDSGIRYREPTFALEQARRTLVARTNDAAMEAARMCITDSGVPLAENSNNGGAVLIADRRLAERLIDWLDDFLARTDQDDPKAAILSMQPAGRRPGKRENKFALRREKKRRSATLHVALSCAVLRTIPRILAPVRRSSNKFVATD